MAMTLTSSLLVRLIDGVSGPATKAGRALQKMLASASGSRGGLSGYFAAEEKRIGRHIDRIRHHSQGMGGLALTGGTLLALNAQYEFEKALNMTQATLEKTKEGFKPVRDKILELAKTYPALRKEMAEGALEMAQANMSVEDIVANLEQAVKGSLASGEDLGKVANGLTDVITGMGLAFQNTEEKAKSFERANNVVAKSAALFSQTYIQTLSAMVRGGPLMRMVNGSLEDMAVVLGLISDVGFKGERGGTGFASSVLRLFAPTKGARGVLERYKVDYLKYSKGGKGQFRNRGGSVLSDTLAAELGLENLPDDLDGRFEKLLTDKKLQKDPKKMAGALMGALLGTENFAGDKSAQAKARQAIQGFVQTSLAGDFDLMGYLQELADKRTDEDPDAINQLFGKHHAPKIAAFLRLMREGEFKKKRDELESGAPGAVDRFVQTRQQGFVGQVDRMRGAWDLLMERLLVNTGVLKDIGDAIDYVSGKTQEANTSVEQGGSSWARYAVLGGLGVAAASAAGFALSGIAAGAGVLAGIGGLLLSPWLAIPGAIAAAGYAVYAYWDEIKAGAASAGTWVSEKLTAGWEGIKSSFASLGSWMSQIAHNPPSFGDMANWGADIAAQIAAQGPLIASAWEGIKGIYASAIGAINSLVSGIRSNIPVPSAGNATYSEGVGAASSSPEGAAAAGRAIGGPVHADSLYKVGERGPEWFSPRYSGHIIPNGAGAGGGGMMGIHAQIAVHGVSDPQQVAVLVADRLNDVVDKALRGIHGDVVGGYSGI